MKKERDEQVENVLTEIESEHDEVRDMLAKIDQAKRITWSHVEALYVTLKGHHEAEEHVLFPKVRPVDSQAEKLVENLIEEHDEAETGLLAMIEKHKKDEQKFDWEKYGELAKLLREHMEEEESKLFKKARKAMTEEELKAALDPFETQEEKSKKSAKNEVK